MSDSIEMSTANLTTTESSIWPPKPKNIYIYGTITDSAEIPTANSGFLTTASSITPANQAGTRFNYTLEGWKAELT